MHTQNGSSGREIESQELFKLDPLLTRSKRVLNLRPKVLWNIQLYRHLIMVKKQCTYNLLQMNDHNYKDIYIPLNYFLRTKVCR